VSKREREKSSCNQVIQVGNDCVSTRCFWNGSLRVAIRRSGRSPVWNRNIFDSGPHHQVGGASFKIGPMFHFLENVSGGGSRSSRRSKDQTRFYSKLKTSFCRCRWARGKGRQSLSLSESNRAATSATSHPAKAGEFRRWRARIETTSLDSTYVSMLGYSACPNRTRACFHSTSSFISSVLYARLCSTCSLVWIKLNCPLKWTLIDRVNLSYLFICILSYIH